MRVLLDTDVSLDFTLQRQPFFVEASEIFNRLGDGDFEAYASAVTPVNVYYFTRKAKDINGAKQAVQDLLITVKISRLTVRYYRLLTIPRLPTMKMPFNTNVLWRKIWMQSSHVT